MPVSVMRLMMALKLASLAQGASGIRLATLNLLAQMLQCNVIPVVLAQGSVGASGDLAPLPHMTAAMIGVGEVYGADGKPVPAAQALQAAELAPVVLGPKEGLALLNGTQFSTANALAGLLEAQRLFQTALVTGALSTDAAKDFVELTGVDALAITIGTSHGAYKFNRKPTGDILAIDRIVPLSMRYDGSNAPSISTAKELV